MAQMHLVNASLYDGVHPGTRAASVVVEGDRIAKVTVGGDPHDVPARDDRVIDLAGRTLMPGMTTCHFHSTYDDLGSRPTPFGYDHAPAYQALLAARNLETALQCGFTGALSAGAAYDIDASMAKAIERGLIPGPRFVPGSRELSTTGHSNDRTPWYWHMPATAAMRICDGPDEFRRAVRDEINRGARVVKLFVTGGHGTRAPKDRTELTRDELAAAIDAAHSRGALIRGHIVNKPAILEAIDLGIDIVDHGDDLDDEVISALADSGTFLVPSVRLAEVTLERYAKQLGSEASVMRDDLARMFDLIPRADAAGVRILLGDDYGAAGLPHGAYADELTTYVEHAGVAPVDVLRWATANGAEAMGRGGQLGTIAGGRIADLLIVDGDPTSNISVLADRSNLHAVIKGGDVVAGALA